MGEQHCVVRRIAHKSKSLLSKSATLFVVAVAKPGTGSIARQLIVDAGSEKGTRKSFRVIAVPIFCLPDN